jgi:hypothetical protein
MKRPEIVMICNRCGKQQEPDKKQSNENWNVFPNVPCGCGGKFIPDLGLVDDDSSEEGKTDE